MRASNKEIPNGAVVAERYEILEVLGDGTSGTVYRARDLHVGSSHEIVALKVIHPQFQSDRQIFGRFRREAKILTRLEGPNLCKLLDFVEEDGLLLIAIELCDGPSLEQYLKDHGPLAVVEAVAILGQVCEALEVAHAAGVVHRDLKPSNVLIEGTRKSARPDEGGSSRGERFPPSTHGNGDGAPGSFLSNLRARVVDFGLAKVLQGDLVGTALTEQDMIFGTPDYMAPEQVRGDELDERCDVYAAGAMLFEMVTGRVVFDAPNAITTMTAHLNKPVPSVREVAPERELSEALDKVVQRALAKDRKERFPSARELARAVASAAAQRPTPADALPSDPPEEVRDTHVDAFGVSTTLQSPADEALGKKRGGAKVSVVVGDPVSAPRTTPRKHAPTSVEPTKSESRVWTIVALVAAAVAVGVGIWFGAG